MMTVIIAISFELLRYLAIHCPYGINLSVPVFF